MLVEIQHTCYPLLLDPPNQKSFYYSAYDISIPLLFSIYESRSKYHTPFTVSTGIAKWSGHGDCTGAEGCRSDKCPLSTGHVDWRLGPLLTLVLVTLRTLHHCTSPCTDCTQPVTVQYLEQGSAVQCSAPQPAALVDTLQMCHTPTRASLL